jgi:outer membrane receptor protein involved in Fe transport
MPEPRQAHARTLQTRVSLRALIAAFLSCAAPLSAQAQTPIAAPQESDQTLAFNLPEQNLASALLDYARITGVRLLFDYDRFAAFSAPALQGSFTRQEALHTLLSRTSFVGEIASDGGVSITDPNAAASNPRSETHAPNTDDIIVTGTRIRGQAPIGSDLVVLGRRAIDDGGFTSTQAALQSLPSNFGGSQNEANTLNGVSGANFAFGSTVDLRGLGSDATLTLVNGRRIAPSGFGSFTDISNIPLVAVDRAEVLADGASSLYGSDAVAGVVNVILRAPSDRIETAASWGAAEGGGEDASISQLAGFGWDSGGALFAFERRDRSRLAASERDYAASTDLTRFGGGDYRLPYSNPGNIVQVGASNVQYAIPGGQDGLSLTEADLLSGVVNYQNAREGTDLLPEQDTTSFYTSIEQALTPSLRIFTEALWGERRYRALDDDPRTLTLRVPETNAYRQANGLFAGQGDLRIRYSFLDDLGPIVREGQARQAFIVFGAEADLPGDWRLETYGAYADERDRAFFSGQVDSVALNAALASSDLSSAFNPFAGGSNTDADVLATLGRRDETRQHSSVLTFATKADGALFSLPAGPLRAAIGAEWREEKFRIDQQRVTALGAVTDQTISPPGQREVAAAFIELLIPVLGRGAGDDPILEASLSARIENYSDFGTTTNPKIGLNWRVLDGLSLRGAYSTSFRAPQLYQTNSPSGAQFIEDPPSLDPYATGSGTWLLYLGGGNSELEPETSTNWTAGIDIAPSSLPDLSLSLTYYSIAFENRIGNSPFPFYEAYTNPERFPGIFYRNPSQAQVDNYLSQIDIFYDPAPGPGEVEAIFDDRLRNIARMDISGIDFHASYLWRTELGEFSLGGSASWIFEFDQFVDGATQSVNRLNVVAGPVDFRSRITGNWSQGPWRAAAAWNFIDGYSNTTSTLRPNIDAWSTIDMRLAYRFGESDDGAEIAFSVLNVFDEDPPFVDSPSATGFDSANASPLGRFASLSVRKTW